MADAPRTSLLTPLGRVLRTDPDGLTIILSSGLVRRYPLAKRTHPSDIDVGDLVQIENDAALLCAKNASTVPLERQDWWRLSQVAPALRARADLRRKVRQYFDSQAFLELEPPTLSSSASLEVHLTSIAASVQGKTRFLQTSPEYHLKRALSAGFERIYSLGKVYRDDESGQHHHAEFLMLEWYRTLEPIEALMDDVRNLVEIATGTSRSWRVLTVEEALSTYSTPTNDPNEIVERLVVDVEPQLATLGAVFLTEYPASLASLAALHPDKPEVSLRFEAYVDGVELANGFGELINRAEQEQRFRQEQAERRKRGYAVPPIDQRFLDARDAGLAPTSGIALGFDRLLMLGLGIAHIDDVTLFPPALA